MRILSVRGSSLSPVYRIRTVEVDGLTEPVPILVAEGAATKAVDDLIAATTRCLGVRELLLSCEGLASRRLR